MHEGEQQSRREALRRVLAGEPVAAVAAALGRSKPWVRKWVGRYDPTDEGWADSHSRAPRTVANRTDEETESLVLKVRLMANSCRSCVMCGRSGEPYAK